MSICFGDVTTQVFCADIISSCHQSREDQIKLSKIPETADCFSILARWIVLINRLLAVILCMLRQSIQSWPWQHTHKPNNTALHLTLCTNTDALTTQVNASQTHTHTHAHCLSDIGGFIPAVTKGICTEEIAAKVCLTLTDSVSLYTYSPSFSSAAFRW